MSRVQNPSHGAQCEVVTGPASLADYVVEVWGLSESSSLALDVPKAARLPSEGSDK